MKMGTIASPFPYDAAARDASPSAKLRQPTALRYASLRAASRFCRRPGRYRASRLTRGSMLCAHSQRWRPTQRSLKSGNGDL